MTSSVATSTAVELALIQGDLSKLSPEERLSYYRQTCESLGLNPLTQPFAYITLNNKLTLYARKDCADQLRRLHGISMEAPKIEQHDDWIVVTIVARDQHGRTDSDVGVVHKTDMRGSYGNALMKAVTKSKRRVTLSMCGLGMLDETEVEAIPGALVREEKPAAVTDRSWIDKHAAAIEEAETLTELQEQWKAVTEDHKAKRINAHDYGRLNALKETRKRRLAGAGPAETGDPESDPFASGPSERERLEAVK